jgi:hypothetical protein
MIAAPVVSVLLQLANNRSIRQDFGWELVFEFSETVSGNWEQLNHAIEKNMAVY